MYTLVQIIGGDESVFALTPIKALLVSAAFVGIGLFIWYDAERG
jgi:hypothetical protein